MEHWKEAEALVRQSIFSFNLGGACSSRCRETVEGRRGHSALLDGSTAFMEYLIVAVILYFILQTAGNLVYILRGGANTSQRQSRSSPAHGWKGPSPRQQMEGMTDHPTFWGEDVEDATWHEVEEKEESVSSGRT